MRSGEIKWLEWSRTDSDTIRLRAVDAKTGKPRSVPAEGEIAEIIERRRALKNGPWIFHLDGDQIGDFRKAWQRACVLTGLGAFYCRECDVKLDANCTCSKCGWKWNGQDTGPIYRSKLFHDFRRPAVRDMLRRGVDIKTIISITGLLTPSMLLRYAIADDRNLRAARAFMHAHRQEQDRASKRDGSVRSQLAGFGERPVDVEEHFLAQRQIAAMKSHKQFPCHIQEASSQRPIPDGGFARPILSPVLRLISLRTASA